MNKTSKIENGIFQTKESEHVSEGRTYVHTTYGPPIESLRFDIRLHEISICRQIKSGDEQVESYYDLRQRLLKGEELEWDPTVVRGYLYEKIQDTVKSFYRDNTESLPDRLRRENEEMRKKFNEENK